MSKVKINNIKLLAETKYLKMYDAEYTNKLGEKRNWSIASRKDLETMKGKVFNGKEDYADAVIIVATHVSSNKLVLIKQFRVPLNDYVYELPAGLVDAGENMETTVRRELKEETGFDLLEIDYEKTKEKVYISSGMTDESVALVYCTCEGSISKEFLEADEDIEVFLMSKDQCSELIKNDVKIDIKALMAIQNYI